MSQRLAASSRVLSIVVPMVLAAGCGARVGTPSPIDGGGGGGGDLNSCHPTSPCDTEGATQCAGERIQTCTTDAKGCLAWSPADPCPDGQTCDNNRCVDICSLPNVVTACTQAAKDVTNCCAGNPVMADDLCHQFVAAKKDPRVECPKYTLQTDCMMVAQMLGNGAGCCCPQDYTCDPENANKCVIGCTTAASCSGNPGGKSCGLAGVNGVITLTQRVCRPDDGKPLHGCELLANNGCDNGYDCWRDIKNNTVCTKSCNADADCGSPGIACCNKLAKCNKIVGNCGGTGACLPCF